MSPPGFCGPVSSHYEVNVCNKHIDCLSLKCGGAHITVLFRKKWIWKGDVRVHSALIPLSPSPPPPSYLPSPFPSFPSYISLSLSVYLSLCVSLSLSLSRWHPALRNLPFLVFLHVSPDTTILAQAPHHPLGGVQHSPLALLLIGKASRSLWNLYLMTCFPMIRVPWRERVFTEAHCY